MSPKLSTKLARRTTLVAATMLSALALAACSGVATTSGGSDGDSPVTTLRVATMATPGSPQESVQDWFMETVTERTNGQIAFDVFLPEAMCSAVEIAECVRDGRADLGMSAADYTPDKFPNAGVVGIPFLSSNGEAVSSALYTAYMENEALQSSYDDMGLTYVTMWPAGRALLGSKAPIENVSDLTGQRIRVTGIGLQTAVTDAGASVVAIPQAETYEALERGVADAVGSAIDAAVDYKQVEVLPYWTDPGTGHYSAFGIWMNKGVHDGLAPELQEIVDEVIVEINTGSGWAAYNSGAAVEQCEAMLAAPTLESLTRWDQSAVTEWQDLVGDSAANAWLTAAEETGMETAQAFLDSYLAALSEFDIDDPNDAVANCIDTFQQ